MDEPTDKQIKFAKDLGIAEPENYTKQGLKAEIDKALKNRGNKKSQTQQVSKHDVVIQRTEKANSYEFGKAGARHKVYYDDIQELLNHIRALKNAGLVADETEVIKINGKE